LSQKGSLLSLLGLLAGLYAIGCGAEAKPGLARGRELFETCVPCHKMDGSGDASIGAPAIAGMTQWYVAEQLHKFKKGIRGAHPDDVEGLRMRPMARSLNRDGDVESVAEYVAGMPPTRPVFTLTGGDVAAGQASYAGVCVVCHGADGKGTEAMRAPSLVGKADWYMLAQLKKFKGKMRGYHRDDIFGTQMQAMSMTLQDEQAMRNVIAYIKTLAK
jgi:cytochrome c553